MDRSMLNPCCSPSFTVCSYYRSSDASIVTKADFRLLARKKWLTSAKCSAHNALSYSEKFGFAVDQVSEPNAVDTYMQE